MRKLLSLITALALTLTLITPTTVLSATSTSTYNISYVDSVGVCNVTWTDYYDAYNVAVYKTSDTDNAVYTNAYLTESFLLVRSFAEDGYEYYVLITPYDGKGVKLEYTFTYDDSKELYDPIIYSANYDTTSQTLSWSSSGTIAGFRVDVCESGSTEVIYSAYTTSNSIKASEIFPANGKYWFKIWIVDANGNTINEDSNAWVCVTTAAYEYTDAPVTVTFDANGGFFNDDNDYSKAYVQVNSDGTVTFPTNQYKVSNMLEGWYTAAEGGTLVDESTKFTSDTTIYAHWTACDHVGGGSSSCWIHARCSICGDILPLADHNLVHYESKDATCTEDGNYEYWQCSGCGAYYSDSNGDKSTTAEAVIIASVGSHSYDEGVVTKEATCTEDGEITYTCSNCNGTYTETTEATGHSYDNGYVTTAATCTEDGEITYTCSKCNDTYTEAIEATGHSYDNGDVTTAATCTEDGVKTYTCSVCYDTYTEAIPATGHTESDQVVIENEVAATCTEDGSYDNVVYCTVCNEELSRVTVTTSATGHSYVDGVCENCGELGASESTTTDSTNTQTSTVVVSDTVNSVLKPNTLDGATVNQATISITSTETGTLTVTEIKDTVTASGTLTFSDSSSSYTFASTEGEITGGTVLSGVETNSSGAVIENTGTVLFYGDIDFETSSNNVTASTLTITLDVSGTLNSNGNITADNIKLLHYENGGWVTVDGNIEISSSGFVTITAETDSYSPFAVILVSEVKKSTYTSQAEALALLMRIQALAANTNTTSGTTEETEETTVDLTEEIVEIEEPVEAGETDLE